MTAPQRSLAELYDESRERIIVLATTCDLDVPVPATPGWTARNLVAHLAGGLGDFLTRRFEVEEGDNFGERTVRERTDRSLDELLAEWAAHRREADDLLAGPMSGVLVAEIISHEQDLRGALGRPGHRDDPAVRVALQRPLQEIDKRLRAQGAPAISLIVDGEEQVIGGGEPVATVTLTSFELLRAVGGRRSRAQLRRLDWSGEPQPDAFGLFGSPRDTDLVE